MPLAASYFRTWLSGSEPYVASPDPPPAGGASPFVVRVGGHGLVPLNVLVFATDVEHAKRRAVLALEECCEKDHRGRDGIDHRTWTSRGRQYELLAKLKRGDYEIRAEPLDTDIMPGIQWASNGGL